MPTAQRRALGSRYELVELIGAGATGHVWRAWDRTDGVYRAAKVLRSELATDAEIVARFLQERAILTQVRHSHIVEMHDLVAEGESLAIVMDLLEGGSLRELLDAEATLPARDAVVVTIAVLEALAVLHECGLVHGDVKPENILLASSDRAVGVRLADFGIARLAGEAQTAGTLGTPAYMPPELLERGTMSTAGDLYAAGVVLSEMLTGRVAAHRVGGPLSNVLNTLLAADPRARGTAADVAEQLRELQPQVEALPACPPQQNLGEQQASPTAGNLTWVRTSAIGPEPPAPLLSPAIERPVARPTGTRVRVVGAGVGIAVLVGFLLWMSNGGSLHGSAGPRTASFTQAKPWPIGLSSTSRASYQSRSGVTLEITLRYQYPITGDLLVVVPAIGADGVSRCAELGPGSWNPPAEAVSLSSAAQRPIACGWRVRDREAAGTTLTLVASLPQTSAPSAKQLDVWLRQIDAQTQAALRSYPASTTPEFALQRITGLQVEVERGGNRDGAVRYRVNARWLGRSAPPTTLLSTANGGNVAGALAELFGLPGGAQAPSVTLGALVRHGGPGAQAARNFILAEGHGLNTQAGPGLVAIDNEAGGTIVATIAQMSSPPEAVR